jgi:hypothetical protein
VSAEPRTTDRLRLLVAELEDERAHVARLAGEFERARLALLDPSSDVLMVYGAAALIESFYTGMEKALRRIAQALGGMPGGEAWHRDLLMSMTLELEGIRPAVLDRRTAAGLDAFLAFRHRFRNLYVFDLERAPMITLLERGGAVRAAFDADVGAFVERIRGWIEALERSPG